MKVVFDLRSHGNPKQGLNHPGDQFMDRKD